MLALAARPVLPGGRKGSAPPALRLADAARARDEPVRRPELLHAAEHGAGRARVREGEEVVERVPVDGALDEARREDGLHLGGGDAGSRAVRAQKSGLMPRRSRARRSVRAAPSQSAKANMPRMRSTIAAPCSS